MTNTADKGGEMSDVVSSLWRLKYVWRPKADITVYELALCIPALCRAMSVAPLAAEQMVDALPDGAKRHFLPESPTPSADEGERK